MDGYDRSAQQRLLLERLLPFVCVHTGPTLVSPGGKTVSVVGIPGMTMPYRTLTPPASKMTQWWECYTIISRDDDIHSPGYRMMGLFDGILILTWGPWVILTALKTMGHKTTFDHETPLAVLIALTLLWVLMNFKIAPKDG